MAGEQRCDWTQVENKSPKSDVAKNDVEKRQKGTDEIVESASIISSVFPNLQPLIHMLAEKVVKCKVVEGNVSRVKREIEMNELMNE